MNKLTQERLKELLHYCPDEGIFTWRVKRKTVNVGDKAGKITSSRYCRVQLDGTTYSVHRLAWLYVYGKFPTHEIDHINRDKKDNRVSNLRDITRQENNFNREFKGYSYDKQAKTYKAGIKVNRESIYLGHHTTEEEAREAYLKAKEKYHVIKENHE